jgi:hypothetical protein
LNQILRPITAFWHPELDKWEATRDPGVSKAVHEVSWPRHDELEALLTELREPLVRFAEVFAEACGAQEFLLTQLNNETRLYESFPRDSIQVGRPRRI